MTMLTEDEAKTKWCPLVRATMTISPVTDATRHLAISSANRGVNAELLGACIASACMAWRIAKPSTKAVIEIIEQEAGENSPAGEGWAVESSGVDQPDEEGPAYAWKKWRRETVPACAAMGFCGAFGKPS